jgi:predicted nucleotidyltransferase
VREVWTDHIKTLPDKRATRDIDFAIYINEHEQYDKLKQQLIEKAGFKEHKEPYRLLTPNNNIVDLIPFGGIEQNGEVLIKGHKVVVLSVFGTKEVTEKAEVIENNFKVITLPGLAILKLIAWHETDDRAKDLEDFYYILQNYADIATDDLYLEENLHLLEEYDEVRLSGARLLGKDILKIVAETSDLKDSVVQILTNLINGHTSEDIDELYEYDKTDLIVLRLKMVKELMIELERN